MTNRRSRPLAATPRRPNLAKAAACALAACVALSGAPPAPADPAEATAAVAGGVLLAGPRTGTKGFYYFYSYRDANNNQKLDPGETIYDEYRLDIKANTWWSTVDYAAGKVTPEALNLFDLQIPGADLGAGGILRTPTDAQEQEAESGKKRRTNEGLVPVIVLATNPDEVLGVLENTSKDLHDQRVLARLVGYKRELELLEKEREKYEKRVSQKLGADEGVVRAAMATVDSLNNPLKNFKAQASTDDTTKAAILVIESSSLDQTFEAMQTAAGELKTAAENLNAKTVSLIAAQTELNMVRTNHGEAKAAADAARESGATDANSKETAAADALKNLQKVEAQHKDATDAKDAARILYDSKKSAYDKAWKAVDDVYRKQTADLLEQMKAAHGGEEFMTTDLKKPFVDAGVATAAATVPDIVEALRSGK